MARNIKYMLTQTVRVDGLRYTLGMTAALLAAISKDQLKDFLERGILEEVPDIGASIASDEPDARDELIESLSADVAAFKTEKEDLERALIEVDNLLKNRSALDDLPTRTAKISKAIESAKNGDKVAMLQKERDDAREKAKKAEADLKKATDEIAELKKADAK